jgi:hypothetical protein
LDDRIAFAGLLVPDSDTVDPRVRHCAFFAVGTDRLDLNCSVKTSEVKSGFAPIQAAKLPCRRADGQFLFATLNHLQRADRHVRSGSNRLVSSNRRRLAVFPSRRTNHCTPANRRSGPTANLKPSRLQSDMGSCSQLICTATAVPMGSYLWLLTWNISSREYRRSPLSAFIEEIRAYRARAGESHPPQDRWVGRAPKTRL